MINDQLLSYIKQQLAKNVLKEIIANNLKSQGWNDADVNEAFVAIGPITIPTPTPVSPLVSPVTPNVTKSKKIISIIVILILLGLAGGAYVYFNKKLTSTFSENFSNSEPIENSVPISTSPTSNATTNNSITPAPAKTSTLPAVTQGQINDCESISDPAKQFDCLKAEYLRTGNTAICSQSSDPDFRSGCYMAAAADKNSYPECKKVNQEDQVFCILVVAAENGDSATCDKFDGSDNLGEMCHHYIRNPNENIMLDMAYLGRGIETKNLSDCYKIQYSVVRQSCLEGAGN